MLLSQGEGSANAYGPKELHCCLLQVDLAALPQGLLLLAYNDLLTDRSRLSLATSANGGESWHRVVVLEADARGSFHYPTIHYLPKQVL